MPLFKKDNTLLFRSFYANVWNGTALFVFISGFLFYHIFYQRGFDYPKFMKQKFRNVFCPYCVTVLGLFLMRILSQISMHKSTWLADPLGLIYKHCMFYSSLWYIPFVMVLFLASPIFTCLSSPLTPRPPNISIIPQPLALPRLLFASLSDRRALSPASTASLISRSLLYMCVSPIKNDCITDLLIKS